ncbi:hypothetical protein [Actinomadura sp.]|uniref:hypothetical protein n=1 Tax=Actinomadura sp. TaxID=1989 RepID=UPI0037C7353B
MAAENAKVGALVMRWLEPKNLNAGAPTSSVSVHLDRLAQEVIREGWKAVPRYDGSCPLLRVFDPAVPDFGESITLVPGTTSDIWWYWSSTGEDLAPHTKPMRAAERITRILVPYVTAALAAQSHQRETAGEPRPAPRPHPDQPYAATVADLQDRSGVICWWGTHTEKWWATHPRRDAVEDRQRPDPETLIQTIFKARFRR